MQIYANAMNPGDGFLEKARKLFDMAALLPASPLDRMNGERLEAWIASGRSDGLSYMSRELDRTDPRTVMPEARSVLVAGRFHDRAVPAPGIARFACGEDYHAGIRRDLYMLLSWLRERLPAVKGRAVVDTAPAFEKAWAVRAGFGWVGRHSVVVNPERGSFFNIGLLFLDMDPGLELPPVVPDGCGECRICIDSCPMKAIGSDRMIDARRCISNLTVERSRHAQAVTPLHGWKYGCDACQECCPYNAGVPARNDVKR